MQPGALGIYSYSIIGQGDVYPLPAPDPREKGNSGFVVLYIIGIIYTFLGISVICDEFFVPSLECIVDALGMR